MLKTLVASWITLFSFNRAYNKLVEIIVPIGYGQFDRFSWGLLEAE